MAFAPDGRIFVAQKNGRVRIVKNGTLLATSFVQFTVNSLGERGLIGIALDPNFSENQYVYLYHTVPGTPLRNRVSRFTGNGDVAVAGSELILLDLDTLGATNHNGGALAFGPDGKLYVAVGDNAVGANSQNLDTYHGKILRINPDGSAPNDNPFSSGSEQKRRVWAYGLRNPYTFSFQPVSGKLYVNDVGQSTWEEINDATQGGLNFGWPTTEGKFNQTAYPAFTNPVYTYQHGAGDGFGCAVTGGTFFNPASTNYPGSYYGKYFFLDFCNNWINFINPTETPAARNAFGLISGSPVIIEVGLDGNLYYISRADNSIYKITYNQPSEPYITVNPTDQEVVEGSTVTFTVRVVGTPPFTYQWQKNNQDIAGAIDSSFTIPNIEPSDAGQYRVMVSNDVGDVISSTAMLSVVPVNDAPVAEIITPAEGYFYSAGTTISFTGTGIDPEDGVLPVTAYSWHIDLRDETNVYDRITVDGVVLGNFDISNVGQTSESVWYRIYLTVTDIEGLTAIDSVDIFPRKTTLSFKTIPPGLQLTLEGEPFETPGLVVSVEGMIRSIGIISPQTLGDSKYEFDTWTHGGPASQTITTPVNDAEYVANFSIVLGVENHAIMEDLEIYPNPAGDDVVKVKFYSKSSGSGSVQVMNVLSANMLKSSVEIIAGENLIELPVRTLCKGLNIILIDLHDQKLTRKIWVR